MASMLLNVLQCRSRDAALKYSEQGLHDKVQAIWVGRTPIQYITKREDSVPPTGLKIQHSKYKPTTPSTLQACSLLSSRSELLPMSTRGRDLSARDAKQSEYGKRIVTIQP